MLAGGQNGGPEPLFSKISSQIEWKSENYQLCDEQQNQPDPVDSAPTDELVVTPAPAKVSLRSNFCYRRRRILSQISTAAPPAMASPSIASLGSISGAATSPV
jgi:hypothetical protein